MASPSPSPSPSIVIVCVLIVLLGNSTSQLTSYFYSSSCPQVFSTIKSVVEYVVMQENRMAASLLRLHFHDCFVNGCDGSVLLDDTATFTGEKTSAPNYNSVRGFDVIDLIKFEVERVCPNVVSCADILAIAARDSVVAVGGPSWAVKLGRRDSLSASFSAANSGGLPPPQSNLSNLINRFEAVGLSAIDMVALSGAHTLGQARCTTFRARIYNDSNIDQSFAKRKQASCPSPDGLGDNNVEPLDLKTPNFFDSGYYSNILKQKGLLHSDQELHSGGCTDSIVESYIGNPARFESDFAAAMIKMGDISPLTGLDGEIRMNCRRVNAGRKNNGGATAKSYGVLGLFSLVLLISI